MHVQMLVLCVLARVASLRNFALTSLYYHSRRCMYMLQTPGLEFEFQAVGSLSTTVVFPA